MSQLLVLHFLAELDRLRKISGTSRDTVVREAFEDLLKAWGKARDLQFIPERHYPLPPPRPRIYPDGALLHSDLSAIGRCGGRAELRELLPA
jgi:hypothetical protein